MKPPRATTSTEIRFVQPDFHWMKPFLSSLRHFGPIGNTDPLPMKPKVRRPFNVRPYSQRPTGDQAAEMDFRNRRD